LRQFADNANAIAGSNVMRFVPTIATNTTDGSGGNWWTIQLASALSSFNDDGTTLDGTALNRADGVSVLNTNAATFGGGTVGVGSDGIAGTGDDPTVAALSLSVLRMQAQSLARWATTSHSVISPCGSSPMASPSVW